MTGGDRWGRAVLVWLMVVGTVSACSAVRGSGEADGVPTAAARRQRLDVFVNALGDLDSEKAVTLGSELKDEAKIVHVIDDGVRCRAGDVLVSFDPTPFEEKINLLGSRVNELTAIGAAREQVLEFEKLQAERDIDTAEVDYTVAQLDLQKLEGGDVPLELSRLEGAMLDAKKKQDVFQAYLKDLKGLTEKGYVNAVEITQAEEEAAKLLKAYAIARQQFESYRTFVQPSVVNSARAKVQRARTLVEQSRKGGGLKIGRSIAELEQSRQELGNQRELLKAAQAQLERAVIKAPQAGLVVLKEGFQAGEFRKPRIGDKVLPGQPLVFLPDISSMGARVLVREIDLSKVAVGKPATIVVDAYPDAELRGTVSFVGVLAERREEVRDGEKYFRVGISLSSKDDRLRPGMTARVRIISEQRPEDVLTIPIYSVFATDRRFHCFVRVRGGFEMREITLGRQNDQVAQVVRGLKDGEDVALSRPEPRLVTGNRPL